MLVCRIGIGGATSCGFDYRSAGPDRSDTDQPALFWLLLMFMFSQVSVLFVTMSTFASAVNVRDRMNTELPEFVFIYCVDKVKDSIPMPSCPCLSVIARLAHISIVECMEIRRLVYILDAAIYTSLEKMIPPILVSVSTATHMEVINCC